MGVSSAAGVRLRSMRRAAPGGAPLPAGRADEDFAVDDNASLATFPGLGHIAAPARSLIAAPRVVRTAPRTRTLAASCQGAADCRVTRRYPFARGKSGVRS